MIGDKILGTIKGSEKASLPGRVLSVIAVHFFVLVFYVMSAYFAPGAFSPALLVAWTVGVWCALNVLIFRWAGVIG